MTSTDKKKDTLAILAHIASDIVSPMLVPSYAMVAAMCLTPLRLLPSAPKILATIGVAFITAIIPMTFILVLIRLGKVSDTSISNPRERTVPFCAAILCYIGAAFFVRFLHAPYWIQNFYLAAAMVSAISLLVNQWWKISAHTGAVGGLAAIIFWLVQKGLVVQAPLLWLSVAFLLVGIVAWARLYLYKHTLLQTFAGALLGFSIELLFLNITPRII